MPMHDENLANRLQLIIDLQHVEHLRLGRRPKGDCWIESVWLVLRAVADDEDDVVHKLDQFERIR